MAPRSRTRSLLALGLALTAVALPACGQDADGPSPFAADPARSSADETASDLGFPVVATRNTTRTATDDPAAAAAAVARAIYSGGAAETKSRAVTLVDRRDWRVALAATALNAAPIGAPILFADGEGLPKPTEDALRALGPVGSDGLDGVQVVRVGRVPRPAGLRATDIAGADAPSLALAIDRFTAAARRRATDAVLVVSAERPEFALPAAAWAAKSGTPIAFVNRTSIPAPTIRQLRDHARPTIYVLGPSSVISPAVTKQLRRYGTVRRTGGQDPAANAVGFARFGDGAFGWDINEPGHGFLFAPQDEPLAAIAIAPLAASGLHGPLLLLDDPDRLPEAVRGYLLDVQPGIPGDPVRGVYNRGWLVGATTSISPTVQSQLDALLEISQVSTRADRDPAPAATTPAPTATTGTTSTAPTPPR